MRSILSVLCAWALASACAQAATIQTDDDAALRAAGVTTQYRLTSIKTECLYFDTTDEGADYLIRVREKHSTKCGGNQNTSPTVFFMKIRKSDGHTTTTAYNVDGKFRELKPNVSPQSKVDSARH